MSYIEIFWKMSTILPKIVIKHAGGEVGSKIKHTLLIPYFNYFLISGPKCL